jgi:hypothetical protein
MMLEELADKMATDGVGTVGTNIFIGIMPNSPDACLALYEYAGEGPMEAFNDGGVSLDVPSVQVMSRGGRMDYPAAKTLIVAARNSLTAVTNETLGTVRFLRVREMSAINTLGPDVNDRPLFTVSFQAVVER